MKKVVIFGYSKTGREIAKLLENEEYEFFILDENLTHIQQAKKDGFNAKRALLDNDTVLKEHGIGEDVDTLFCMSNDDSLNLFVTLSARNLDKKLKILTLIYKKEDEKKMLLAGANRTISPYEVGAIKAFRIIDKPKVSEVLKLFTHFEQKLSIIEIEIQKNSLLDGVYFKDIKIFEELNLIFLGILDRELGEEFIFFSKGVNHKIDSGDIIVVLGAKKDINKLNQHIGIK